MRSLEEFDRPEKEKVQIITEKNTDLLGQHLKNNLSEEIFTENYLDSRKYK
jgi:hypothetical protein